MSLLSLTFHAPENHLAAWEKYVDETLSLLAENLMEVDQYVLSEVESDMISEGKNYNLLLFFATPELRDEFLKNEFLNIQELIEKEFGENIMIFQTALNPRKSRS